MGNSVKRQRWWDWLTAILLLAALVSVSVRLNTTDWTEYLEVTEFLVIFGVVLGLALGFTRFSGIVSFLISLLYGMVLVPWQLSLFLFSKSAENYLWYEKIQVVVDRLGVVFYQLQNNELVQDSILFLIIISILFWFLGIYSGFSLVRYGNAWLSLFPAGITLVIIHIFDPGKDRRIWFVAAFIFFSLLLVGRVAYQLKKQHWQQTRTALPPALGFEFVRFSFFTVSIIILLAWLFPTIPPDVDTIKELVEPVQQEWKEIQEQFDNVFASLKSSLNVPLDYFGPTLTLGSGNKLTNEVMFWVNPQSRMPEGVRLYWRARIYSQFNGRQWYSPTLEAMPWNSEEKFLFEEYDQRWDADFEIISSSFFTSLFSPAQVEWTDREGAAKYLNNPDGSVDLYTFQADPLVRPGQIYAIHSSISNAAVYDMRKSGSEYPQHIKDRYLQLPETITPRTTELARRITTDFDNPYDQVKAIVTFLRQNIAYSDIINPPPTDQDVVDWLLFDSQVGFCNYYASAAVVMLRSIGIPSRFVVGYATGEEMDDGKYLVRQREAHAWPEVYFNGLGWVEFEPTASQPDIDRLPGVDPNEESLGSDPEFNDLQGNLPLLDDEFFQDLNSEEFIPPQRQQSLIPYIIAGSILIVLAVIIIFAVIRIRHRLKPAPVYIENLFTRMGLRTPAFISNWSIYALLPSLVRSYMEINHALSRHNIKFETTTTPGERANLLNQVLPTAEQHVNLVLSEYQIGMYSNQPADIISANRSGKRIRQLSRQKFYSSIKERLRFFPRNRNRYRLDDF